MYVRDSRESVYDGVIEHLYMCASRCEAVCRSVSVFVSECM